MKLTIPTYEQTKRFLRIALTVFFVAMAAFCLGVVLFLHRPDHLLTTAGYALMAYAINVKDKEDNKIN